MPLTETDIEAEAADALSKAPPSQRIRRHPVAATSGGGVAPPPPPLDVEEDPPAAATATTAPSAAHSAARSTNSNFAKLRLEIVTPSDAAAKISALLDQRGQSVSRHVASFLQAVSGRTEIFNGLFETFPAHVWLLMEKLCDTRLLQEPMDAYKAEFIIRARGAKVHKAPFLIRANDALNILAKSKNAPPPPPSADLANVVPVRTTAESAKWQCPLLEPRALLESLWSSHPSELAERRVQLADSVAELASIVEAAAERYFESFSCNDSSIATKSATSSSAVTPIAFTTLLVSHVYSKVRRVLPVPAADDANSDASTLQRNALDRLVRATHELFVSGRGKSAPAVDNVPAKVLLVLKYVRASVGAFTDDIAAFVDAVQRKGEDGTASKIDQMTQVARIKESKTVEELDALVDELTDAADGVTLRVRSPDVLSSLAVAASALGDADEGALLVKERVALLLQSVGVAALPRRAKAFVDAVNRHKKRARPTDSVVVDSSLAQRE